MKKVVGIIGASGLVGSALAMHYEKQGWEVIRYSRQPRSIAGQEWRMVDASSLAGLDVVINLAGDRIDKRWTEANKQSFYESRVEQTRALGRYLEELSVEQRPSVWMNASAVGIYGDRGDEWLDEDSESGRGYLAELVEAWEAAVYESELEEVRRVTPRIGVVLGARSPAWNKMAQVFRVGLGGRLGDGSQYFPWIHIQDLVEAWYFLSVQSEASGVYNMVSPEPVKNCEFTRMLSERIKLPAIFPVPRWVLRVALGEFSSALLASLRVKPRKLEALNYSWRYGQLPLALKALISTK
ncbi:TIGR01777 family oxidoreductase [Rubritalea tangerina]|uniref:TIGR01777 family oxidoreductase n=1 Tax=Rubritalea tangerina TaxID=430798 RepID=A0ABW4ZDR9_9BACT